MNHSRSLFALLLTTSVIAPRIATAEPLRAGVARIDITHPQAARVNDPCYAKALVLSQGDVTAVLITIDAVAIGGIGAIRDTFMDSLRQELAEDPAIPPAHALRKPTHP